MSAPRTLGELLALPVRAERREPAWDAITSGDTLFQALRAEVSGGGGGHWGRHWEQVGGWETDFLRYLAEETDGQEEAKWRAVGLWETVRGLVWCAERASLGPEAHQDELDHCLFELGWGSGPGPADPWTAWGWIRTFLEAPSRGLAVPVALWDKEEGLGHLAELRLEVVEGGGGAVFPHPADAFATRFEEDFRGAMQDAWRAARALVTGSDLGGCYRLRRDGRTVPRAGGRSAGGAAAWGWWHALQSKVPDAGVLVLAEVRRGEGGEYALHGVDGVPAKVDAVARGRNDIDTIVVADGANLREAEDVLNEANLNEAQSVLKKVRDGRTIRVVPLDDRDA